MPQISTHLMKSATIYPIDGRDQSYPGETGEKKAEQCGSVQFEM